MISPEDYFHDSIANFNFEPTDQDYTRAADLLDRVNDLMADLGMDRDLRSGHRTREKTEALIKAGYRAAVGGNHEKSLAVDVADSDNALDEKITDAKLAQHGLWREAPASTESWCHLQSVQPASGHRTFFP